MPEPTSTQSIVASPESSTKPGAFTDDTIQLQDVLDALDDPDCRTIINHLDEPKSASELANHCNIPLSTLYRKLDLLSESSLLEENIQIRTDGGHTTKYEVAFEEVRIGLTEDRSIEVTIKHRDQHPGRQLSELWSEVRKEP